MHLIRLLIMGAEILEGKGIHTYREKDKDFLLDIRNGKYSYEQLFEMVDEYDARFKYAKTHCTLPDNPDYEKIKELIMQINKRVLEHD